MILASVASVEALFLVDGAQDLELAELSQDVAPEHVIEKIEERADEPKRRS